MYFLYWNDLHPVSHSCIAYVKLNYPKNPFTLYNVQSVFICNICQHCINQSTQKTKDIPAWRAYSLWLEWLDCAGHQMKIEQWLTPSPHQHGNTHFLWKLQNQFFLYQKSRKKDRMLFFFLRNHWEKCFLPSSRVAMPTTIQNSRQCWKKELRASLSIIICFLFFLRSGRETIFSAYTTDVDLYVSYF